MTYVNACQCEFLGLEMSQKSAKPHPLMIHSPESAVTVYRYNFYEFIIKTSTPLPIISGLDSSVSTFGFLSQTQQFQFIVNNT